MPPNRNEPVRLSFTWPYPRGIEFKLIFDECEITHNLPRGLLSRVGWQESKFREDIIKGEKVSSAGAVGIMQIVPKWHPEVDPYDPVASIRYAASYLVSLHKMFSTWELALAAYNWGPGNLMKHAEDHSAWPDETKKYTREILADAYEILTSHTY